MSEPDLYGRDVLDVLALIESKTDNPNAALTLLTCAISLVAIHHGIRLRDLRKGLEQAFRQTVRKTPNFSRNAGVEEEH